MTATLEFGVAAGDTAASIHRLYPRFLLRLALLALTARFASAAGQKLWSISFPLVAAPAIRADGSLVAQSKDTLLLVSSNGTETWRQPVSATTSGSAQPPMIDDAGNILVLTASSVNSYDAAGALRWSFPLPFASSFTSLALGQSGQIIVKTGDDWYALDTSGHVLWSQSSSLSGGGAVDPGFLPQYSASPAIVAPDGTIRSATSSDQIEVRSIQNGKVTAADPASSDGPVIMNSALLGLGPSAECLVLSARQAPPLTPPVPTLPRPSAGNFRVRWTHSNGTGSAWSNAFVLGSPLNGAIGNTERVLYGLCAPRGEVLVATEKGTVIMPHDGIGSRRWSDTAFAVADTGDVVCWNGTQLVVRHPDQSVSWSAPAEGSYFTLAPGGRVYGGTASLSAYDVGLSPAAGPWAQPRGDPRQTARAPSTFGPFTPNVASLIDAAAAQSLSASYAGQVQASPYVQGPGTATWEKDDTDVGPAADDDSLVIPAASSSDAGSYRLRIDTARGAVRSAPIAVSVAAPAAIRPGLYWGRLPLPNNALYCLEITPDRYIRYLTSDGSHFTPAMNVRLDPTGGYPWHVAIPQYDANVTLLADRNGVTVAWQSSAPAAATPAMATLAGGARTGWYDGNYVGPLNDGCTTELALLPDGTLIGKANGLSRGLALPLALDPQALSQTLLIDGGPGTIPDQLTVNLTASGRMAFELRSFPYSRSTPVRFEAFAPGTAPVTRLINLSARSHAGSASGTLTAGFVVADPGTFLVRGVGPSLTPYGVTAPLATPVLRLTLPNGTVIAENRGWSTLDSTGRTSLSNAATQSGAFPLQAGSSDSALLAALQPGAYTALLSSADDGEALAEVYVLPPTATQSGSRLVNLSARGRLSASNPMLTIGFVHVTDAARRILIRGIGPGLKPFVGDASVCSNPRLRVYDASNALLTANNDWGTFGTDSPVYGRPQTSTVMDAASASGAFALGYGSADAALVLNLPGGQYTVQLDSQDGSTGEVLFEVYAVP